MKLIIFGATGGTGRELVSRALRQGHEVTAFARNPARLGEESGLRVLAGDVLDYPAVENALSGMDAALIALGAGLLDKSGVRARGTENVIRAMEKHGVRRLICQSGYGAGESFAGLPFLYRRFIMPVILRRAYADHNRQEDRVRRSALDWTIVRPSNLTDGEAEGKYRVGFTAADKSFTMKISRADTAEFMLRQLTEDEYLHAAPGISR